MKHYVVEYKMQKSGQLAGMCTGGPFDTREEADQWHTDHGCDGMLCCGADDLGPEWGNNLLLWANGNLTKEAT